MKCVCGGEMWPDSYERPKRPVEWFLRCPNCGNKGPSVATFEEAMLTVPDKASDERTAE